MNHFFKSVGQFFGGLRFFLSNEWSLAKVLPLIFGLAVLFFGPLIIFPEIAPAVTQWEHWPIVQSFSAVILWGLAMYFFIWYIIKYYQHGKNI